MKVTTLIALLLVVLVTGQSCATQKLWESTNPNERIWVDASKITEEALQKRGVIYSVSENKSAKGYLIEKSGWQKFGDYHLRLLGTPVAIAVDAVTTVTVVGVLLFLNEPEGTCELIKMLAD